MKLNANGYTVLDNEKTLYDIIFNTDFDERVLYDIEKALNIEPLFVSIAYYNNSNFKPWHRDKESWEEKSQKCFADWENFYQKFCNTYSFPCVIKTKIDNFGENSTKIITINEYIEEREEYLNGLIKEAQEEITHLHNEYDKYLFLHF